MSLDVSPDGKTIVFDLLGDLYTIPITGGDATRIMGGLAMDVQPRYSPDGQSLVFVSDRSGTDNIWVCDANGGHPRAIINIPDTATAYGTYSYQQPFAQPVWTPDGTAIIAGGKRYDLRGGGGVPIPGLGRSQIAFGGDPRYAYFPGSSQNQPGDSMVFHYDKLFRYDFRTGRPTTIVRERPLRPVMRPAVSPDNRWLVYVVREDDRTALRIRDLRTDDERWLTRDVGHDASDAIGFGTATQYPGYAFTPDSKSLVMTADGKIWKIDLASGTRTPIPFRVTVEQELGPMHRFSYAIRDTFTVRQIREPRLSPDGRQLAFVALDKVYVMDFPNGTPRRVTQNHGIVEMSPAWSPDGAYLAFSTFDDTLGGDIYRVRPRRGVRPERLTTTRHLYTKLAYSPDGTRLVYARGAWREFQSIGGPFRSPGLEWYWMQATKGGEEHRLTSFGGGMQPVFVKSLPDHVAFATSNGTIAYRWDGSDARVVLRGGGDTTLLAPTGSYAVTRAVNQLYLFPVPPGANDSLHVDILSATPQMPVRKISRFGAEFPAWTEDGTKCYYALGHTLFVYDVAGAHPLAGRDSAVPARYDITVRVPRDRAIGTIVLRGARLITMRGDDIIEHGDLVIRDGRIVAVGRSGSVVIPSSARVVDVTGKTILPGYVDVHAHNSPPHDIHKTQDPRWLASLAYGVTTVRDPQTQTSDFLTYDDRLAVGDMLGPRAFGTGHGLAPWRERFPTFDATRDVLRRFSEFYDTQTIKEYVAGNRKVRQWMIIAAGEQGLTPTTEGGGDWKMDITELLDGYPAHEHNFPMWPLYRDLTVLIAASGTIYDPVLMAEYGVADNGGNYNYWIWSDGPYNDPKIRRFATPENLEYTTSNSEEWLPPTAYDFPHVAASLANVVAAGGSIGFGEHGTFEGPGHHWELQMLGSGGMPPLEVLRAATLTSARSLGLDRDIGSLETGKIADLQILDKNPLDELHNTLSIRYVMRDGYLYDATTMDRVWPTPRRLPTQWWWSYAPPTATTVEE